jgi:hypothetical protein
VLVIWLNAWPNIALQAITIPLLAEWIRILLQQRKQLRAENGRIELVMTGPEPPGAMIRDTGVVVRQMFRNATQSICICGFAVYQGKDIFLSLANRMQLVPDLSVRVYLNIERPFGIEQLVAKLAWDRWPCNGLRWVVLSMTGHSSTQTCCPKCLSERILRSFRIPADALPLIADWHSQA